MKIITILFMCIVYIFACTSDFDCSYGNSCVKKPYSSEGVCMQNVNQFGVKQYVAPKTNSVMPRMDNNGCSFDMDCPIGFRCDSNYKVCVKR